MPLQSLSAESREDCRFYPQILLRSQIESKLSVAIFDRPALHFSTGVHTLLSRFLDRLSLTVCIPGFGLGAPGFARPTSRPLTPSPNPDPGLVKESSCLSLTQRSLGFGLRGKLDLVPTRIALPHAQMSVMP
jgi:hypothetical protein